MLETFLILNYYYSHDDQQPMLQQSNQVQPLQKHLMPSADPDIHVKLK